MRRRILFVAMQMSSHVGRWIDMISDRDWDLHLFPVNHGPVLPEMGGVTVHLPLYRVRPRRILKILRQSPRRWREDLRNIESSLHPHRLHFRHVFPVPIVSPLEGALSRLLRIRLGESEQTSPFLYGPHVLAHLVQKLQPDLVHSMEFQHCGYNVLRAKELSGEDFPPWLATNWGSDIYYYRAFEDHRAQIERLLRSIDYYSCECARDLVLAKEFGLKGRAMSVMPNTGGFDLERLAALRNSQPPSRRRLIMLKGYQHFAGRAMTALDALERCADALKHYDIIVFSASSDVASRARQLHRDGVLNCWVTEYLPHEQILRLHARARIYLSVSISDAIGTSMLEAMVMGAFPIQTNTSCCEEWIEDGKSGYVIPADDVHFIAERVRRALADDALVDRAAHMNWRTVQERLAREVIKKKVEELYDEIFAQLPARGRVSSSLATGLDGTQTQNSTSKSLGG